MAFPFRKVLLLHICSSEPRVVPSGLERQPGSSALAVRGSTWCGRRRALGSLGQTDERGGNNPPTQDVNPKQTKVMYPTTPGQSTSRKLRGGGMTASFSLSRMENRVGQWVRLGRASLRLHVPLEDPARAPPSLAPLGSSPAPPRRNNTPPNLLHSVQELRPRKH